MREIRPSGSEGGGGSIPLPTSIEEAPDRGRSGSSPSVRAEAPHYFVPFVVVCRIRLQQSA